MSAFLARRSHYIPWIFAAGFALIIAVNGTMIWLALSSFSGLYTTKPREVGLRYNAVISERDKRDALGWRIDASWQRESGTLVVRAMDASGQPLSGARIGVELVRPVEKRPPLVVAMTPVEIGRFEGRVELPDHRNWRGNWDVDIVVERGRDRYALTRRMLLQ